MAREEPFVPGIDPGLRKWLVMRAAARELKLRSASKILITCECSYKYKQYWTNRILTASASPDKPVLCEMSSKQAFTQDQFESLLKAKDLISPNVIAARVVDQRNDVYLRLLLTTRFNINTPIGRGKMTLLHMASRRGDLKKLTILLQHGANVHAKDAKGRTALYVAIQPISLFHSMDILKKLIEYKSSLNNKDCNGLTILHRACIVGNKDIIQLILKQNRKLTCLSVRDVNQRLPADFAERYYEEFMDWCYRMCNKRQNVLMWARIVAKDFVTTIFQLVEPQCVTCKRKLRMCGSLKKSNYRLWMLTHNRLVKEMPKRRL